MRRKVTRPEIVVSSVCAMSSVPNVVLRQHIVKEDV